MMDMDTPRYSHSHSHSPPRPSTATGSSATPIIATQNSSSPPSLIPRTLTFSDSQSLALSAFHAHDPASTNPLLGYYNYLASAGYNTTNTSARTSYTRVDQCAMDNPENDTGFPIPIPQIPQIPLLGEELHYREREWEGEREGGVVEEKVDVDVGSREGGMEGQAQTVPTSTNANANAVEIPQTPQISLCFLLISGKRRVMSFDPETGIGRVKELVWNAWPGDWQDERPPTPSHLRILHLGKILQDEETLKGLGFPVYTPPPSLPPPPVSTSPQPHTPTSELSPPPVAPPPTIVHLSIRPAGAPLPADDMKKKRRSLLVARLSSLRGVGVGVPVSPTNTTTREPGREAGGMGTREGAGVGQGQGEGGEREGGGGGLGRGEREGQREAGGRLRRWGCCVIC